MKNKMNGPLVSVIVPVYNCEPYIEKCVKSIQIQTYSNIEIIVVNDGSTDKSAKVIARLAAIDSRIKYLEQENKGVSNARNHALDVAKGKWCCFVDADDQISPNYISIMINNVSDQELVFVSREPESSELTVQNIDQNSIYRELILDKNITGVPWNKLFRLDVINKSNLRFNEDIRICEDLLFNIMYAAIIDSAVIIKGYSEKMYLYNTREGSALHSKDDRIVQSALDAYELILNSYSSSLDGECTKRLKREYSSAALRCILFHTFRTERFDKEYIKEHLLYAKTNELNKKQTVLYLMLRIAPKPCLKLYMIKHHKKLK